MSELELLNSANNAIVARYSQREYPGILVQGDTLRTILDDIEELKEELASKKIEAAQEISDELQKRFVALLTHYEAVLDEHDLPLPYLNSVSA